MKQLLNAYESKFGVLKPERNASKYYFETYIRQKSRRNRAVS
jgi:hypothetical protein